MTQSGQWRGLERHPLRRSPALCMKPSPLPHAVEIASLSSGSGIPAVILNPANPRNATSLSPLPYRAPRPAPLVPPASTPKLRKRLSILLCLRCLPGDNCRPITCQRSTFGAGWHQSSGNPWALPLESSKWCFLGGFVVFRRFYFFSPGKVRIFGCLLLYGNGFYVKFSILLSSRMYCNSPSLFFLAAWTLSHIHRDTSLLPRSDVLLVPVYDVSELISEI